MSETVYLIGAGLTRSLELPGHPVPLMMNFVQVMADYVSNPNVLNSLRCMELGDVYAAACPECKDAAWNIPEEPAQRSGSEVDAFAVLVKQRPPESVEDLLSRNHNRTDNIYASGLDTYFRYAINQIFATIEWNLEHQTLETFLRQRFENEGSHTFVSFNYDLVLDRCVQRASGGNWSPVDGYGFVLNYFTTQDPKSDHPGDAATAHPTSILPRSTPEIRILKPHGSLNWLAPRDANAAGKVNLDALVVPLDTTYQIRYWSSLFTFNHIQAAGWPHNYQILIAPPSPEKTPVFRGTTEAESSAIVKADEIIIIGYSFPESDLDQETIVRKAIASRGVQLAKLTVVNNNAPRSYFDRMENIFRPVIMDSYDHGFIDFAA
jgi:hypothetical protein